MDFPLRQFKFKQQGFYFWQLLKIKELQVDSIHMDKIGVYVATEQKGFLIALAYQFEKKFNFKVTIIASDKYVYRLAKKILPSDSEIVVINYNKLLVDMENFASIFQEAKRIEDDYGVKLSMLMSEDRALGQGYLSNVQKVPGIKRAWWSHEKKTREIVIDIVKKEKLFKQFNIAIQIWPNKISTMIYQKFDIAYFSLIPIKFGDRVFWSDNEFITGSRYIDRLNKYKVICDNKDTIEYEINRRTEKINKSAKYTYIAAVNKAIKIIINDSKNFIRGINKKDSYYYLGWLPSVFRSVHNYNYVKKNSVTFDNLSEYKVIFLTLHMEPEVALQSLSPEFNNSMEIITWISKSLPVNYIIVVKEQANSYAVRSKWYYKQLIKMPNVVLSHPDLHSWKWIKFSDIVATITGTVGQEAVHFEKPVISFGRHQVINHLPTVYYASNYSETNKVINRIIQNPPSKNDYSKSRVALSNAQLESSIDIPEYKNTFKSVNLETSMASKALSHLVSEYPNIFK